IAAHLEQRYPDRPSLFGGATGQALARFVNDWVDRTVLASAFPAFAWHALALQDDEDRAHFGGLITRVTGRAPDALATQQPRHLERLVRAIDPARATLKRQPFLAGAAPSYADYALFSVFQWGRIIGAPPVLT